MDILFKIQQYIFIALGKRVGIRYIERNGIQKRVISLLFLFFCLFVFFTATPQRLPRQLGEKGGTKKGEKKVKRAIKKTPSGKKRNRIKESSDRIINLHEICDQR